MVISFRCSQCGKAYKVGDELAGKKGECACGVVFHGPAGNVGVPKPDPSTQRTMPRGAQSQAIQPPAGGSPLQPLPPMGEAPVQQLVVSGQPCSIARR